MRLSFLVESPILYLAFFKTILAALFRTFGLPLRFLPSKPSFLHDHFTTQHSDFFSFLAVSKTDEPVNRSIHANALMQLPEHFCFKGVYLLWYSQKTKEGVRAIWTIKFKKYVSGKYTRALAPLAQKYTNWIFESKGGITTMKIAN